MAKTLELVSVSCDTTLNTHVTGIQGEEKEGGTEQFEVIMAKTSSNLRKITNP